MASKICAMAADNDAKLIYSIDMNRRTRSSNSDRKVVKSEDVIDILTTMSITVLVQSIEGSTFLACKFLALKE